MDVPGSLYFQCPKCDDFTLHHIIKAKFSTRKRITFIGTAKCTSCDFIHHVELKQENDRKLNLILSSGATSEKTSIDLPGNEFLEVGMELMFGEVNIMISKLEKDERSLGRAQVKELDTIWAKKYESVPVRISISHGPRTYSRKLFAAPDEEFEIGDIISFHEYRAAIKKIKDRWGMVRKGFVKARDIVRVYCAIVKE